MNMYIRRFRVAVTVHCLTTRAKGRSCALPRTPSSRSTGPVRPSLWTLDLGVGPWCEVHYVMACAIVLVLVLVLVLAKGLRSTPHPARRNYSDKSQVKSHQSRASAIVHIGETTGPLHHALADHDLNPRSSVTCATPSADPMHAHAL
jgi:hypothetical protein